MVATMRSASSPHRGLAMVVAVGKPARDVLGEAGAGEHGGANVGDLLGQHVRHQRE